MESSSPCVSFSEFCLLYLVLSPVDLPAPVGIVDFTEDVRALPLTPVALLSYAVILSRLDGFTAQNRSTIF